MKLYFSTCWFNSFGFLLFSWVWLIRLCVGSWKWKATGGEVPTRAGRYLFVYDAWNIMFWICLCLHSSYQPASSVVGRRVKGLECHLRYSQTNVHIYYSGRWQFYPIAGQYDIEYDVLKKKGSRRRRVDYWKDFSLNNNQPYAHIKHSPQQQKTKYSTPLIHSRIEQIC